MSKASPAPRRHFQTQEVRGSLRHARRRNRVVHRGPQRNDLHYRGYDICDLAAHCEFEEVAHLLVHGKLPNAVELVTYKPLCAPCAASPRQ